MALANEWGVKPHEVARRMAGTLTNYSADKLTLLLRTIEKVQALGDKLRQQLDISLKVNLELEKQLKAYSGDRHCLTRAIGAVLIKEAQSTEPIVKEVEAMLTEAYFKEQKAKQG